MKNQKNLKRGESKDILNKKRFNCVNRLTNYYLFIIIIFINV
jgi:hypothetical protein